MELDSCHSTCDNSIISAIRTLHNGKDISTPDICLYPWVDLERHGSIKQTMTMQELYALYNSYDRREGNEWLSSSNGSQESTVSDDDLSLTLGLRNLSKPSEGKEHSSVTIQMEGTKKGFVSMDLGLGLMISTVGPGLMMKKPTLVENSFLEASSSLSEAWCLGEVMRRQQNNDDDSHPKNSQCSEGMEVYSVKEPLDSVHGEDDSEIDLQLGLSGSLGSNGFTPPESNGFALGCTASSRDAPPLSVSGMGFQPYEHTPIVDEGSTSAKAVKSGGAFVRTSSQTAKSSLRKMSKSRLDASESGNMVYEGMNIASSHGGVWSSINNLMFDEAFCSSNNFSHKEMHIHDESFGSSNNHLIQKAILLHDEAFGVMSSERAPKACKFEGCGKGARGASGLCIAHGGGKRCQRSDCNKGAEGRTMFCKAHGGGRRCQNLGCIKSADGKTDFCIAHGGGKRCIQEGCGKAARGKSGLCIRHGGGKRCQREGCNRSAEGFSGLCISHGGGRRCQYPQCGKGAQGSTKFCKAHGGGRRCEFLGCTKGAEGSTPLCKAHGGGKRCSFGGGTCSKSVHGGTLFCVAHGGGKRCMVPACTKSARGRTEYCVRHGGGKRCMFNSCTKSAQGSTDYCKAHGGGKRCQRESKKEGSSLCGYKVGSSGVCCSTYGILEERFGTNNCGHHSLNTFAASSLNTVVYDEISSTGLEERVHGGGHFMALLDEQGC